MADSTVVSYALAGVAALAVVVSLKLRDRPKVRSRALLSATCNHSNWFKAGPHSSYWFIVITFIVLWRIPLPFQFPFYYSGRL
jgi:hypothetical protein